MGVEIKNNKLVYKDYNNGRILWRFVVGIDSTSNGKTTLLVGKKVE